MKIDQKRKLMLRQFEEHLSNLNRSLEALRYSYSKCEKIYEKEIYDNKEQESLEALTARFARSSDILTQKVLKTLFALIQEHPKTFLDAANLLEKIEVVDTVDDIINIRELRNQIAHEYVNEDLRALFTDVLKYAPDLERLADSVREYATKHLLAQTGIYHRRAAENAEKK